MRVCVCGCVNLSYGTYVVLAVGMCVGSLFGFAFIGSPRHVVREDGVPVPYLRSEVGCPYPFFAALG